MYKNNVSGILLLNKPRFISSNHTLQKIKNIFSVKKAGYIGTLDPIATGILPICFGEATKLANYLVNSSKMYYTIAKFGQITSTYDSQGVVLENRRVSFTENQLQSAIKQLKNCKYQVVPSYSALKYHGKELYKYTRNNVFTPKIIKNIDIYKLNYIKYNEKFITLKIHCSKGTYVRTLVHDLGKLLKCGAHVIFLKRLKFFNYNIHDSIEFNKVYNLKYLYDRKKYYHIITQLILPLEKFFSQLPEIIINSYKLLQNKSYIHSTFNFQPGICSIKVRNCKSFFIIGEINHQGQLISYKKLLSD